MQLVTLAEAREAAFENRKLARAGGDPLALRAPRSGPTFAQLLDRTIEVYADGWKEGSKTESHWRASMRDYALPRHTTARKHHMALHYSKVAEAIPIVAGSAANGSTKRLHEFLILTATRSGEDRKAVWPEFDLEAAAWTIPGRRTKSGRAHRVPLSPRAIAILRKAEGLLDGSAWVSPSPSGQPIRLGSPWPAAFLARTSISYSVSGFRSMKEKWVSGVSNPKLHASVPACRMRTT